MYTLDLSNVSGTAQAPFLKATGDHLNNAIDKLNKRHYNKSIPTSWYTANDNVTIISGCELVGGVVGSGIVAFDLGIYDFENPNNLADGYFVISETYIGSDPVKYSDGNNYNQHKVVRMILQASSVGSTGVLYSGNSTRFMNIYENNKNYATNKISASITGVSGNQFLINATAASSSYPPTCSISILNTGATVNEQKVFKIDVMFQLTRSIDAVANLTSGMNLVFDLTNWIGTAQGTIDGYSPFISRKMSIGFCYAGVTMALIKSIVDYNNTTKKLTINLNSVKCTDGTTIDFNGSSAPNEINGQFSVNLLID